MNKTQVKRYLLKYRNSLEGYALKNKLIFDNLNIIENENSLFLSIRDTLESGFFDNNNLSNSSFVWSSKEFEKIFYSKSMNLNQFLLFNKNNDFLNCHTFKMLEKLNYISDNYEREFDTNCLYLLGPFLTWHGNFGESSIPIFKIPVSLIKDDGQNFKLIFTKRLLRFNETLLFHLRNFFNINIEIEKEFLSPKYALHYLCELLRKNNIDCQYLRYKYETKDYNSNFNQFLIYDFMNISVLDADNYQLYSDYKKIIGYSCDNNLIYNAVAKKIIKKEDGEFNYDNIRKSSQLFPLYFDSDLSSLIKKLTKEDSIIAKFPAGSEKISIITNLIIKYLSNYKKILFISNNNKFIKNIYSKISEMKLNNNILVSSDNIQCFSDIMKQFEKKYIVEDNLNFNEDYLYNKTYEIDKEIFHYKKYFRILNKNHEKSGLKNIEVINKAFYAQNELYDQNIYKKLGNIKWSVLSGLLLDIDDIQYFYNKLDNNLDSPWLFKQFDISKKAEVYDSLVCIYNTIINTKNIIFNLNEELNNLIKDEKSKDIIENYYDLVINGTRFFDISYEYKKLWEDDTNIFKYLQFIIEKLEDFINSAKEWSNIFNQIKDEVCYNNIDNLEDIFSQEKNILKFFSIKHWKNKNILKKICSNCESFETFLNTYKVYEFKKENIIDIFNKLNFSFYFDSNDINAFTQYCNNVLTNLKNIYEIFQNLAIVLSDKHYLEITSSYYGYKNVTSTIKEIYDIKCKIEKMNQLINCEWEKISLFIDEKQISASNTDEKINFIKILIEKYDDIDFIHQYNKIIFSIKNKCFLFDLDLDVIKLLLNYNGKWKDIVFSSVTIGWLKEIYENFPDIKIYGKNLISNSTCVIKNNEEELYQFILDYHQYKFNEYSQKISDNCLNNKFENMFSSFDFSPSVSSITSEEMELLLQIKPCWFVNLNDVSKVVPLIEGMFDLVILDVVKPSGLNKIIPCIYRAKKVLLTCHEFENFNATNEYEKNFIENSSSVFFKWVNSDYNESLVTFANYAFYDFKLFVPPKPSLYFIENDLHLIEITSDRNELDELAKYFFNMIIHYPNQSYAVITSCAERTFLFIKLIKNIIASNPSFSWILERINCKNDNYKNKCIIVKSIDDLYLEKFDVILLSLGNNDNTCKSTRFDDLKIFNTNNSAKYIHKIIASVKKRMILFTSVNIDAIDTSEKAFLLNSDQCICGRFLKYFKFLSLGQVEESINILKSFKRDKNISLNKQNEFALFVKHKLEDLGYKVSEMVGLNNIYMDLGIRHPLYPEKYILGIECDNGILHSSLNVMDYINIRSNLLTKVGWYIEKIYCLDWLKNSEKEIDRIDGIIKKIILKELIETSEKLDLEHIQEENNTTTSINDLQLYL